MKTLTTLFTFFLFFVSTQVFAQAHGARGRIIISCPLQETAQTLNIGLIEGEDLASVSLSTQNDTQASARNALVTSIDYSQDQNNRLHLREIEIDLGRSGHIHLKNLEYNNQFQVVLRWFPYKLDVESNCSYVLAFPRPAFSGSN